MKEGAVILYALPQANGKVKYRPAVILRELPSHYHDMLVCGVSSQLEAYIEGFDEVIGPEDGDFTSSGVVTKSVIRLGFLAVLSRKSVAGSIGEISKQRHHRLLRTLSNFLIKNVR